MAVMASSMSRNVRRKIVVARFCVIHFLGSEGNLKGSAAVWLISLSLRCSKKVNFRTAGTIKGPAVGRSDSLPLCAAKGGILFISYAPTFIAEIPIHPIKIRGERGFGIGG